jgi:beta-glucosidase
MTLKETPGRPRFSSPLGGQRRHRRRLGALFPQAARRGLTWATLVALCACGGADSFPTTPLDDWPRIRSDVWRERALEARVDALLGRLSLAEKVGQMTQVEIQNVTPDEIRDFHIGSVLNGGGSHPNQDKGAAVADWLALADALWAASMDPAKTNPIPLIWGTDAVHGHGNVKGATLFPHNIGLGAAHDPDLLRRIGEVTATEVARTGIDWVFSPTLAVVRDDRWGRTYEGFSEDPLVAQSYGGEMVYGLQGRLRKDSKAHQKVVATAKHFIGDGGTTDGRDQGVTAVTELDLINVHGRGYYTALSAGAQTVMASFNSWQDAGAGAGARADKMHGHKYLMTDVLKDKMGFDGFIVSDWNGIGQVNRANSDSPIDCSNADCPHAINAGIDMVMVPYRADWRAFIANTLAAVERGDIPQARIDDAVRRILRVKMRAGLFEKPAPSARNTGSGIGTPAHRAVAREAVRKSLVLLKNNGRTLPLSRSAKVLVAGKGADSLSVQSGGWSITWQGTGNTNADFGGGTTLWQAVQKIAPNAVLDTSADGALADASYDAAVVAIGETPYAEGQGDIGRTRTLELARLRPEDLALINALKARGVQKIVTVLFSGRPLYTSAEINRSDAFVAAWLPGTEGEGLTDVLFRNARGRVDHDFHGRLSYSWPRSACQTPLNLGDAGYDPLYAYGYGLSYARGGAADQPLYDETTQPRGCGVPPGDGGTAREPLAVLDGANQGGWAMRIGAPSNWGVMVELATSVSTTTPAQEITATPVDDRNGRQWAAMQARWNSAPGQIYMQSLNGGDTQDLRPYLNAQGAVVFDVRVTQAPTDAVFMRIDCVWPCLGEINVTQALQALPLNTWAEAAVPLYCFADRGTDFSLVNTPFLLYSSGQFEMSVGNIRWEPQRAGNVACQ